MNNRFKFRLCYTAQDGSKTIHYTDDRILIDLNGVIYENYGKDWKSPMWETVFDAAELPFIQQFTGLTDKNNKEVYEGDIVRISQDRVIGKTILPDRGSFIAEVIWNNARFGFQMVRRNVFHPEASWAVDECYDLSLGDNFKTHIEVIGNIFENSDLLK